MGATSAVPLVLLQHFTANIDDWDPAFTDALAAEREFGRLKREWGLLPLRVRGIERVQLHAGLTILAKLSCALARARVAPLAA